MHESVAGTCTSNASIPIALFLDFPAEPGNEAANRGERMNYGLSECAMGEPNVLWAWRICCGQDECAMGERVMN